MHPLPRLIAIASTSCLLAVMTSATTLGQSPSPSPATGTAEPTVVAYDLGP